MNTHTITFKTLTMRFLIVLVLVGLALALLVAFTQPANGLIAYSLSGSEHQDGGAIQVVADSDFQTMGYAWGG